MLMPTALVRTTLVPSAFVSTTFVHHAFVSTTTFVMGTAFVVVPAFVMVTAFVVVPALVNHAQSTEGRYSRLGRCGARRLVQAARR
jgi:hypothetical protein